jgi:uncharacterized DUF497 family protein
MGTQNTAWFEWDEGNWHKCQKHGVSIREIEAVFHNGMIEFPDPTHSEDEDRFISIGKGCEGRSIFVVFTVRHNDGNDFIRPISARYMHQKEIQSYEEALAKIEK